MRHISRKCSRGHRECSEPASDAVAVLLELPNSWRLTEEASGSGGLGTPIPRQVQISAVKVKEHRQVNPSQVSVSDKPPYRSVCLLVSNAGPPRGESSREHHRLTGSFKMEAAQPENEAFVDSPNA